MVKTADGYKAIARIRAGDRVFAKDEASGETGYKPVTARYGNPYQETVYIEVSDGLGKIQTLVSNRIHPFYSGGKWIKAEDLKAGSRLHSESGTEQTVQSITVKQEPLQAYNLTVADWHTYSVKGDKAETEGVWVHNACPYGEKYRTEVGSYTNTHESGRTYSGKGTRQRSQISGAREARVNNDPHIATDFTPAKNNREAFKDESRRIDAHGGSKSTNNYNRIESPGKKYRKQDGD